MPKINNYVDISTVEKEAKKDYIDRHSPFVHVEGDHYIAWVQLWDGDTFLGQATFVPGVQGNQCSQAEVDFYIVPTKNKLKLQAMSYCTKHGLWQGPEVEVEVQEAQAPAGA